MKKTFSGYYRPTDGEFVELWKKCLFIFDANVILNLYRYSKVTSDNLLDILKLNTERIWMPHQAGLEYQNNRPIEIKKQIKAYDAVKKIINDFYNKLDNDLRDFQRHPFIDIKAMKKSFKDTCKKHEAHLDKLSKKHPDLLSDDKIREIITTLFDDKVGNPYTSTRLAEIYKDGKIRYENKIPPGYLDMQKGGTRQYGDLILWFQIIDKAKEIKKPIIFVTDDRKEDWWLKVEEKTIGPQPALLQEIFTEANIQFYMYSSDQFMKFVQVYLNQKVEKEAIEEVKAIRQNDEKYISDIVQIRKQLSEALAGKQAIVDSALKLRDLASHTPLDDAIRWASLTSHTPLDDAIKLWASYTPTEISAFTKNMKNLSNSLSGVNMPPINLLGNIDTIDDKDDEEESAAERDVPNKPDKKKK